MTYSAGVDSSTQGCKVVIVDVNTGETVRKGRASHPPGSEVDPEYWWKAYNESVHGAGGLNDVSAISVSGQQHGLVALDKNGRVVRPALLWNDTRSAPSAKALIDEIGGPEVYAKRVGIVPVASFTASKLRWVRDNEPELAAKIAAVCLPHDWLTWRILGYGPENPNLEALTTDRSDASGTAYWSGETGKYNPELFKHALGRNMRVAGEALSDANVDTVIVPRVLQPNEKAGKNGHLVVGAGTGDNAGGALGLEISPHDLVVSLGTSGAVFSPQSETLGDGDPSGVVAGFSSADGIHLPLVCTLNGARILESGARLLNLGANGLNEIVPLALAAEPGAGGLVLLPYFEGERTPNLPDAKASLHNLTIDNANADNLARAHVEGLICSMAQAIDSIKRSGAEAAASKGTTATKKSRVLLIGGAAANKAVQEVAASVFDVEEIHIPVPGEYVARGAALQAAWALAGSKPRWALPVERTIKCSRKPIVMEQYLETQKAEYPELFKK